MSAVERLFEEFRTAHAAGSAPDPQEFLARADEADRNELATLIEAHLMRAPRRPFDAQAFEQSHAAELTEMLGRSLGGTSGLWPAVLPRLRDRARLRRAELVERLAAALGVAGREEKVGAYYHEMERGLLPAQGVSDRVLEALAQIVGTTAAELRRVGECAGPELRDAAEGAVFARTAPAPERMAAKASPGTSRAEEPPDEVDELFRGG